MLSWLFPKPADRPIKQAGMKRSSRWPAVRAAFLKDHPACEVCGATKNLNVHHVRPFHLVPALELNSTNLITLCETPARNCHLTFGHLLNWSSYNATVAEDAAAWSHKIKGRP